MPSPMSRKLLPRGLWFLAAPVLAVALGVPLVSGQEKATEADAEPQPEFAAPAALIDFLPEPESVRVVLDGSRPDLGNTRMTAVLDAEGRDELLKVTGRNDFAVVGTGDAQVILRDDGRGGDPAAGDGRFTAFVELSTDEAQERQAEEDEALAKTASDEPVFDGRSVSRTEKPSRGFEAAAFLAGQEVEVRPAAAVIEEGVRALKTNLRIGTPQKGATVDQMIVPGTNAFQEKALMIRDVSVVTDPSRTYDPCTNTGNADGAWAFKHLISEMANTAASGIPTETFVQNWLDSWLANPTINGDLVPSRNQIAALIANWQDASGVIDLDRSPLRLLAIVNRVDLARTTGSTSAYGGAAGGNFVDAGELRFVFGFVARPGDNEGAFINTVPIGPAANDCHALPFTVILEYGVPKCDCKGVRDWSRRWCDLGNLTLGSAIHRARLERLTRQITRAGADPTKPNGSAINQVRTNEIALQGPWQLREFQLTQAPFSFLSETTVNDTPRDSSPAGFDQTPTLDNWVNTVRASLIAAGNFEGSIPAVPLFFPTGPQNFLAAHANVPTPTFAWDTTGGFNLDIATNPFGNWARHRVSRAACNGCHAGETDTFFVHVDPTDLNKLVPGDASLPAELSGFLTGITVADPKAPGNLPNRDFDDLARRQQDLKRKGRMLCSRSVVICRHCVLNALQTDGFLPEDLTGGKGATADHLSLGLDVPKMNFVREVH